jgi:hypothetical protein
MFIIDGTGDFSVTSKFVKPPSKPPIRPAKPKRETTVVSLSDDDQRTWTAFATQVTPLGQPEPSRSVPPPLYDDVPETDVLDLHGFSLADAYAMTLDFVTASTHRSVTVVTGLSGAIKREFPMWLERYGSIRLEELDGGGAYRLHFRRDRKAMARERDARYPATQGEHR